VRALQLWWAAFAFGEPAEMRVVWTAAVAHAAVIAPPSTVVERAFSVLNGCQLSPNQLENTTAARLMVRFNEHYRPEV